MSEETPPGPHRPEVARNLFRIVQEAVNNAVRHSGASKIQIRVAGGKGWLNLSITDNGRGLPPAEERSAGMGLRSMQYRAGMLAGSLELASTPGEGTTVRFLHETPKTTITAAMKTND